MKRAFDVASRQELADFIDQLLKDVPAGQTADEFLSQFANALRHIPWVESYATAMLANSSGLGVVADAIARTVNSENQPV